MRYSLRFVHSIPSPKPPSQPRHRTDGELDGEQEDVTSHSSIQANLASATTHERRLSQFNDNTIEALEAPYVSFRFNMVKDLIWKIGGVNAKWKEKPSMEYSQTHFSAMRQKYRNHPAQASRPDETLVEPDWDAVAALISLPDKDAGSSAVRHLLSSLIFPAITFTFSNSNAQWNVLSPRLASLASEVGGTLNDNNSKLL